MNGIDTAIGGALGGLKRTVKHLYWRAYGLFLIQPPIPPSPRSLLFVCKGNICRSPFAEAMARRHVPDGLPIAFRSAGIDVGQPEGCPRETLAAAETFGIDLSGHRSRQIDAELVAGADMVLAMEAWQASRLRKVFPEHREKVYLLPLFEESPPGRPDAGRLLNIRDPYGRAIEDFIECFERIEACLKGIFSGVRDAGIRPPGEERATAAHPGDQRPAPAGYPRDRAPKEP